MFFVRHRELAAHPATLLLVAFSFAVIHALLSAEMYPMEARLAAACTGVLAYWVIVSHPTEDVPFLPYACSIMYIAFGSATFWHTTLSGVGGEIYVSEEGLIQAAFAGFIATASMAVIAIKTRGVAIRLSPSFARLLPSVPGQGFTFACRSGALVSCVLYFVVTLRKGWILDSLVFAVGLISTPQLFQALLFFDASERNAKHGKVIFWLFTSIAMSLGVLKGMLSILIKPMIFAAILLWIKHKRFSTEALLFSMIAATVFVVLQPAKGYYRNEVWFGFGRRAEDIGVVERLGIWKRAVERTWGGEAVNTDANLQSGTTRVAELTSVAQVIDWVPRVVPHAGWERWLDIPMSYIPRVFWPGKPAMTRLVGDDYQISFARNTSQGIDRTAINLPLPAEGYWYAGWFGVVINGAAMGLLIGLLQGLLRPSSYGSLAIGLAFLAQLAPHSFLMKAYGGLWQKFIGAALVVWCVALVGGNAKNGSVQATSSRGTARMKPAS